MGVVSRRLMWVESMGVVSRRLMWVESMGVVVRRCTYIYLYTPLVSVLFCSSIPTFCSLKKMFFVLYIYICIHG